LKCLKDKPLEDYHLQRKGRFGRRPRCKGCYALEKAAIYKETVATAVYKLRAPARAAANKLRAPARAAAYRKKVFKKFESMPALQEGQESFYTEAGEVALRATYDALMPVLVPYLTEKNVTSVAVVTGTIDTTGATLGPRFGNATADRTIGKEDALTFGSSGIACLEGREEVKTWLAAERVTYANGQKATPAKAMLLAADNFIISTVGEDTNNPYAAATRERILQQSLMDYVKANPGCGIKLLWSVAGVGACTPKYTTLQRFDKTITKESTPQEKLKAVYKGGFRFGTRLVGVYGADFKHNDEAYDMHGQLKPGMEKPGKKKNQTKRKATGGPASKKEGKKSKP